MKKLTQADIAAVLGLLYPDGTARQNTISRAESSRAGPTYGGAILARAVHAEVDAETWRRIVARVAAMRQHVG